MPKPLGLEIITRMFVDADYPHAGDGGAKRILELDSSYS